MNVLVTGGAGYIGSHAVRQLLDAGHGVVVADNLYRGHSAAVDRRAKFVEMSIAQTDAVEQTLRDHRIECVMHFAALTYVGESVQRPLDYYQNNTAGSLSLLMAMQRADVRRLVFSSTAATYGEPEQMPILETTEQRPINPYGSSKLMFERIVRDYAVAEPRFAFAILRYFNVAGCAADGSLGEDHDPETHLIPSLLQAVLGQRDCFTMFGDDYPTPDGTCIRDYVHVEDLCAAHVLALEHLTPGAKHIFNVGIGRGYSVRQIIESVERVTGAAVPLKVGPRRAGDPPSLYTNSDRLQSELGWKPAYTEIDAIIRTAWRWFEAHPAGYRTGPQAAVSQ